MLDLLRATYERLIQETETKTYRYLYAQFQIKNRLTGLIGPRGVGKTTLLLQFIKNHLYHDRKVFYCSADHLYFTTTTLLAFVHDHFMQEGIRYFFIDEIHRYPNWSQELKNIYDSFPQVYVVFSGSSSLDILKGSGDLSRRAKLYYLHGLSFREYLNFYAGQSLSAVTLQQLIEHRMDYNAHWPMIEKIQGHFLQYLANGYYPFVSEDPSSYYEKIIQVIEKTIMEDIAGFYNLKTINLYSIKKMVHFFALIPPGKINAHNLAKNLSLDSKTVVHYLGILEKTGLIRMLYPYEGGDQQLRKPEKVFLNNTTLLSALNSVLSQATDIGMLRELFFIQTLSNGGYPIFYSKEGDFRNKEYIFEIGGKNKTTQQIRHTKTLAFLVKDHLTVATNREIPLYYFGFLY